MYIIAQDGTGDFTTIQAAVDAVSGGNRAPTILLIRPGKYQERLVIHKDNLRLVGEDRDSTVITYSNCAKDLYPDGTEKGTFLSASVIVTGVNVTLENLTIRNDAGDGRIVGQAVALFAAGDRGTYRNCNLIAHQDTLFTGPLMPSVIADISPREGRAERKPACNECTETYSREYFENCYIQGDIDFIFGSYRCWFERCTLFMNERGGWYTAANTPETQSYGYVFHQCTLTGACAEGAAKLGRPWRRFARTVFLDCEMDAHVAPEGFADWDEIRVVTERYVEYGTTGARADQKTRHPSQKRLSASEAARITIPEVIGGWDHWRPDQHVPTWYLCGDSTMADYAPNHAPMAGWGQMLQALTDEEVHIENCAVCGRSSKSFIDENRLHNIACCIRPGDKLIISFSHNDEKQDPARHTDAETTFLDYLNRYIELARNAGAEPVLATPIARRLFSEQGQLVPTHGKYPDAMRAFASRQGIRLVDLEKATRRLFMAEGPEGTKRIFCHLPPGHPNYPNGAEDNSHLQEDGATRIAQLFLKYFYTPEPPPDEDVKHVEESVPEELIAKEDSILETGKETI